MILLSTEPIEFTRYFDKGPGTDLIVFHKQSLAGFYHFSFTPYYFEKKAI